MDVFATSKLEGIKIRTKCNWYEERKKSLKFSLNVQKNRAIQKNVY